MHLAEHPSAPCRCPARVTSPCVLLEHAVPFQEDFRGSTELKEQVEEGSLSHFSFQLGGARDCILILHTPVCQSHAQFCT